MKKLLYLVLIVVLSVSVNAEIPEVDVETQLKLEKTLKLGSLLIDAVGKDREVNLADYSNRKDIQKVLKANKCKGLKYKAYEIKTDEGDYLYLIASKGRDVIIGRHFKVPMQGGLAVVEKFESSTNSCLNLGTPPDTEDFVGMSATTLKPLPDEFHVLTAAVSNIDLYVASEYGIFTVKPKSILLYEKFDKEDLQIAPDPVWKKELTFWCDQNIEKLLAESGLNAFAHEEFPNDITVAFFLKDKYEVEIMWVTVRCYDPDNELYMGTLINQPNSIKRLNHGDNIVFKYTEDTCLEVGDQGCLPVAGHVDWDYPVLALPESGMNKFRDLLYEGWWAYIMGNFGHNMPGIEESIKTLDKAGKFLSDETPEAEKFLLHFITARCYAEKYEILNSIEHFRAALKYKPADIHANMGLLAQYSIAVWMQDPIPGEDWEKNFTDHMNMLKEKLGDDEGFQNFYKLIYVDEVERSIKEEGLTGEEKERTEKFGPGSFSWKQR